MLQGFPKNTSAADVKRSKCLHATSSNAPFLYIDDVNYFNLITVMFPTGSIRKHYRHVKNDYIEITVLSASFRKSFLAWLFTQK